MEGKGPGRELKETALRKSSDSTYTRQRSLDNRKIDEKFLITDMDVKEAMKKLTQSVHSMEKPSSNEDFSHSSSGHRFYNWNTTHFYPDVHKLDIGILFRHNERPNKRLIRPGLHSRKLSDLRADSTSSSSSDCDNYQGKTDSATKDNSTAEKMSLANNLGRRFAHGHTDKKGLGVKIDIDLDSGSDSNDDDRGDQWHRSPLRVRRIQRHDGRPLSAEINYDAASKKLYIHTLSKKIDAGGSGRLGLEGKGRNARILRRQSAPSSEVYSGIRKNEGKTEKGCKDVSQNRFPNAASVSGCAATVLSTKAKAKRPNGLEGCMEKHNRSSNREARKCDKAANFHSLYQSHSQEDMSHGCPENSKQNIQKTKQFGLKHALCTQENLVNEMKFHGLANNHFQPIDNFNQVNILMESQRKENGQSDGQFLPQYDLKSPGHFVGTSSSFENIYDSFSNTREKLYNDKFVSSGRRCAKISDEPSAEQISNDRFSKNISRSCLSSTSSRSENMKEICKSADGRNLNFSYNHKSGLDQAEKSNQLLKKEKLIQKTPAQMQNNSMPNKSHLDAKTLIEEEKQKFADYKLEYRRQLSGGQDCMSEPHSNKGAVSSQRLCSEENRQSSRFSHPNVNILKNISQNTVDSMLDSEAKMKNLNATKVSYLINAEIESGKGMSIPKFHQRTQKWSSPNVVGQQKPKAVQLPSEICLAPRGSRSDSSVTEVADVIQSQHVLEQKPKGPSAFHRIIKTADSLSESSFLEKSPVQSRRPDLIPSPSINVSVNVSPDAFSTCAQETGGKAHAADLLSLGCKPYPVKLEPGLLSGNVGLLQKPPKPRKDESSGNVGPKDWTYNTSYKPGIQSVPPSDAVVIYDKSVSAVNPAHKAESRNSAFADMIPSNPHFSSSASMDVFRSLPEQYRLSIQEPASPVTDSFVSRNGLLPLYHKESGETKQKLLHDPVFIKELNSHSLTSEQYKKSNLPMHTSAINETYLTDDILKRSKSCSKTPNYDKATVFSLTGFHVPKSKHGCSSEKEAIDNKERHMHFGSQQKPGMSFPPSFEALNSDILRQTQWTDAEKRRPMCWTDTDKRRPIVDWPDLDAISPDLDLGLSSVEGAYLSSFDCHKPDYNVGNFDLKNKNLDLRQRDQQHLHSNSFERQSKNNLKSSTEHVSSEHPDFASLHNYHVGVRSSEISNLEGSKRSPGSDAQVFYAVKFLAKDKSSFDNNPGNNGNEVTITNSPSIPPSPFSHGKKYNDDAFNLCDSHYNKQRHIRQSFGETEIPCSPVNDFILSNVKDTRSFSQPDCWKPNDRMTSFNNHMKEILDPKIDFVTYRRQDLPHNNEHQERNAFHSQSKASAEYEKHVNRSQESYKAKKLQSIGHVAEEQAFTNSFSLTPPLNLHVGEKLPEMASIPKQKSALELHLSSSYGKCSGSPAATPAEDCRKVHEPFNIEVNIRPPNAEDSPQVYDMSVRLSGSQEKMNAHNDEEFPQISVAEIKAKLFGQNEDKNRHLTGRQLAFQTDQNVAQNWTRASNEVGKSKPNNSTEKTKEISSDALASKFEKLKDDEILYNFVSYKDGITKKRSKINDHLTEFERVYEDLDFDDYDNNCHALNSSIHKSCPDSSNLKRLSITNLKLLTENQEKLVPNSNLEYTKEWILTGKGYDPFPAKESCMTSNTVHGEAESFSNQTDAGNVTSAANFPRKQLDDMAYRRYGSSNVKCARSDPDLPVSFVQVCSTKATAIEPTKSLSCLSHVDQTRFKEGFSSKPAGEATKKVELQTRLSFYQSPSCEKQLNKTIISRSPIYPINQSVKQIQPGGTRINLRVLQRSSSLESRDAKPETQSPSSCVGKLMEIFEISQSAPDLTESVTESYEEAVCANMTPMATRQKTPKDVKLKSEKRSKAHLLKLNTDSGYVESENDSHSSPGMENQPLVTDFNLKPTSICGRMAATVDSCVSGVKKINAADAFKSLHTDAGNHKQVMKSETPFDRSNHMKKLRDEFFTVKEKSKVDGSEFGFGGTAKNRGIGTSESVKVLSLSGRSYSGDSVMHPRKFVPSVNTDSASSTSLGGHDGDFSKRGVSKGSSSKACIDLVKGPEILKTTLNLNLTVPTVVPETEKTHHAHVSFPAINRKCKGGVMTCNAEPDLHFKMESSNQAHKQAEKGSCEEIRIVHVEKDKVGPPDEQAKSLRRNEGKVNSFRQSKKVNETIREIQNAKFVPQEFGRIVHQPATKSVAFESQESQESFSSFDGHMTKQQTQTRSEQVYKIEKKTKDISMSALRTRAPPLLLDRLEFSDGEMTDATDVTLDAMVHFNQRRPSSTETLDFSDIDMSSTSFSSKIKENQKEGIFTRSEVVQKSYAGSRTVCKKSDDKTTGDKSSNQITSSSDLLANAKTEMKLYRKDKEQKSKKEVLERRRSIKELVDTFEVMTSPFMRARQRSTEVRSEDVEKALITTGQGQNAMG